MTQAAQSVLQDALQLPDADRVTLVDQLLETIHGRPNSEVEEAWDREIAKRIQEIDEGRVQMVPGQEVMAKMRKITNGDSG